MKKFSSKRADEFEELVKDDVSRLGFDQEDKRFNRKVRTLSGHFVVIKDPKLLAFYRTLNPLKKYIHDWSRMIPSYYWSVSEAKRDPASRQLMVFNDQDFAHVAQCFTSFQFILTARGEYDMYVYQRSADMAKFRDDVVFFAKLSANFQKSTKIKVTKIVIVYGSIHYEI